MCIQGSCRFQTTRTLAQKRARSHDAEPNPQPVYHAAEEGDQLVAEQRRERDDDEDGDRYQPSGREVAHFLGPRAEVLACALLAGEDA